MRVLHINTYDTGGAAIACIRLHRALLEMGIDSHLLTLYKTKHDIPNHLCYFDFVKPINQPSIRCILKKYITTRLKKKKVRREETYKEELAKLQFHASKITDWFSFIETSYSIDIIPDIKDYDIINLHWVADFLDWDSFFSSINIKNVVWTLHDMNPFTGGYHYAAGYEGFKTDDSAPPFLLDTFKPDFARIQLLAKRNILLNTHINIKIVAPSVWLRECSINSILFSKLEHFVIPNSLSISTFKQFDKTFSREVLNLPQDKIILLFVSDKISNKRKGFELLVSAFNKLNSSDCVLCSIGASDVPSIKNQVYHLGKVLDERIMAMAYNAADIFVQPSKEDNLPNVVIESLCCGTPVVGFNVGGMRDKIFSGFNGYLSNGISSLHLLKAIKEVIKNKVDYNNKSISIEAKSKYSPNVQAKAYIEVFNTFV